jgi:hypothetical protein
MKILFLVLICLCFTACTAQDNRELNIYLESSINGYFAIIYKKDNCNSQNKKLYFHIDSTGIFKTDECFVSSNIITKHRFYLRVGNDYKQIGYKGGGYNLDIDSIYVSGVESLGTEGWNFMIYKLGTLEELSEPITENSKDLQEFEDRCIKIVTAKIK